MNNTNLVRTTTYFDPTLLNMAKKQAIDEGKSLYEVINEALRKRLGVKALIKTRDITRHVSYKNIFPTFKLGLGRKKIKRSDAYNL